MRGRIIGLMVVLVVGMMGLRAAADSIIVANVDLTGTAVSGGKTYSYTATLDPVNEVKAGDYFTIYDFQGLVGAISMPADWAFSSSPIGPTPPSLVASQEVPKDSAFLPNVTFTYTGVSPIVAPTIGTDVLLGTFTVKTTVLLTGSDTYVAQDTDGVTLITNPGNRGDVNVPFDVNGPFLPLPLTSVAGMGLMGLVAVGRRGFRRARAK